MANLVYKKVHKLSSLEASKNKEWFINKLKESKRPGIQKLLDYLDTTDFYLAPSSSNYHNNYYGGLVEHVRNVYDNLVTLNDTKNLGISNDTIIITSLLHDLCKINTYTVEEQYTKVEGSGSWVTYSGFKFNDIYGLGHSETSIMIAQRYIALSHEELCMIRWHMGIFELSGNELKSYNKARELFKGVVAIHLADMMASTFDEVIVKSRPTHISDLD